jgi:hypothetical protein
MAFERMQVMRRSRAHARRIFAVELLKLLTPLSDLKDCATCPSSFWDPVVITRALSCCHVLKFGRYHTERKKQHVTGYVPYSPLLQEMAQLMPLRRTRVQEGALDLRSLSNRVSSRDARQSSRHPLHYALVMS